MSFRAIVVIPSGSEESVVGAQFIAPRNQGVINHAPTEERFLPSVEMTKWCGRNDKWRFCMNKTIAIYQREMKTFFVSPVAYIVSCIFLITAGYLFSIILFYTHEANLRGLFDNLKFVLLFMAPILTMRLLAEEKKLGTDELLFTSPLTNYEVILGKYFAAVTLYLIMLIFTIEFPVVLKMYSNPDMGPIYSGYLGIFLFGSAFISVGLFASSITENQIVAAIISFGLLLILWLISWATVIIPFEWAKNVLTSLSLIEHYNNFEKGAINSGDIFYYLSFCFLFIFLTNQVMEAKRWK
ncbi:MAG: ABC transporter permease subunit [bacterium]